jgi:hypothetical protein
MSRTCSLFRGKLGRAASGGGDSSESLSRTVQGWKVGTHSSTATPVSINILVVADFYCGRPVAGTIPGSVIEQFTVEEIMALARH